MLKHQTQMLKTQAQWPHYPLHRTKTTLFLSSALVYPWGFRLGSPLLYSSPQQSHLAPVSIITSVGMTPAAAQTLFLCIDLKCWVLLKITSSSHATVSIFLLLSWTRLLGLLKNIISQVRVFYLHPDSFVSSLLSVTSFEKFHPLVNSLPCWLRQ